MPKQPRGIRSSDELHRDRQEGGLLNSAFIVFAFITIQGARVVYGGERIGTKGYFVQPTIFADCTEDMTSVREEIFGPV